MFLFAALLLISGQGMGSEPSQGDQKETPGQEISPVPPELADIVPLAAGLAGRLADLKRKTEGGLDISAIEKKCIGIETHLSDLSAELERLRDSRDYKYSQLVELRKTIGQESVSYEAIDMPIRQAIRRLESWRKEWLAERKRWDGWQSSLQEEGDFGRLESTFTRANETIHRALDLVLSRLEATLRVQERAGSVQANIFALAAESDDLIAEERRSALLDESPPMISYQFFSQFESGELWSSILKGVDDISWPDRRFVARQGWIVLFQGFLSVFVIIITYRNRRALRESKRWLFFAARPVSAGLFFGCLTTMLIYEYQGGAPATLKLANMMIAGISFARLMGGLLESPWKRRFVNGLITVLIVSTMMELLGFPLALFRLYTVFAALIGLIFCLHLAGIAIRHKAPALNVWLLRSGALFLAVIIITELWDKKALASHLFVYSIRSTATVLVFTLFAYMIRGGMEWLFRSSPLRQKARLDLYDAEALIRRLGRFMDFVIVGLILLPAILVIWGVYDSLAGAIKGMLSLGFSLGTRRISLGLLLASAAILYGAFLTSWILQKLLMDEVLFRRQVERGVRVSIARLAHYVIVFLGFLFALSTLGVELTKITIMLSALGVGIGFGLQGVVNNFVSGLILLFERPVRVGDYIELSGEWSEIKRIGIRATTVQTFDGADLIIPNADLISNQVTNWTLTNRQARLIVPVGVAYGSDVPLVMETLLACADANSRVAKAPAPQVLFLSFGESSLEFELRLWVGDADYRLSVRSEVHQEIDRRFREAKIEIPFPQRDVHLRSANQPVILDHTNGAGDINMGKCSFHDGETTKIEKKGENANEV
jgi:small-conductance mechanosensitive channel